MDCATEYGKGCARGGDAGCEASGVARYPKDMKLVHLVFAALVTGGAWTLAAGQDATLLAKAQSGDAAAQMAAGEALEKSAAQADADERPAVLAQAVGWYRKAAEQKLVAAEVKMAEACRDGRGVARDAAQAAAWYRRAAEQGDTTAQATLGTLYSMGRGVTQDYSEAYFWFDVAALTPGPNQTKYAALRQQMGTQITAEELANVQHRMKQWRAAHPQP